MRAATKSRLVAGEVGGGRRQASRCMCAKKHSGSRSPGPGLEGRTKADRTQARTVVRELSNARAMGLAEEATRGTQRRAVDDSRARGGSMSRRLCHVRRMRGADATGRLWHKRGAGKAVAGRRGGFGGLALILFRVFCCGAVCR
jgi:hypothetical protein